MRFLSELMDRPIAFHRSFVDFSGVTGALFLSQSIYWQNRTKSEDGYFYKTALEWEEETGMTQREQSTARERLRSIGILEETKRGIPCKCFYRVNTDVLYQVLQKSSFDKSAKLDSINRTDSFDKSAKLDSTNRISSGSGNRESNSEITHYTTSETTHVKSASFFNSDAVIQYWNQKTGANVLGDPALDRRVVDAVSQFGIEQVKTAIDKYWRYLNDDSFYWSKRFTLFDFLLNKSSSGLAKFIHETDESMKRFETAKKQKRTFGIDSVKDL